MIGEVATKVVLVHILLHHLEHVWVIRVLLEVGVGTWDGPLQVTQLGYRIASTDVKDQHF